MRPVRRRFVPCRLQPRTHVVDGLDYLGQINFPTSTVFDDTTVGGLSAITYDAGRQVYYIISDDRSARNPARFYTVRIMLPNNRLTGIEWLDTTSLLDRSGTPFPPLSPDTTPPVIPPDPEGIAFDERRQQLFWSSEGERIVKDPNRPLLLDPWVRIAGLDGAFRGQYALPPVLSMSQQDSGARTNNGLEGLTLTPSGNFLFAGMEDPGFNDGSLPTADAGPHPHHAVRRLDGHRHRAVRLPAGPDQRAER